MLGTKAQNPTSGDRTTFSGAASLISAYRLWLALAAAVVAAAIAAPMLWPSAQSVDAPVGQDIEAQPAEVLTFAEAQRIVQSLTRMGVGGAGSTIETIYAPPAVLMALGVEGIDADQIGVFITENIHEDLFTGAPPIPYLLVDGQGPYAAADSTITQSDIHHRTARYIYDSDEFDHASLFDGSEHTLTLVVPTDDGQVTSVNRFVWSFPLDVPYSALAFDTQQTEAPVGSAGTGILDLSSMTRALRRTLDGVTYGGVDDIEIDVTYAPPEYFEASLPPSAAAELQPETSTVFLVAETLHDHDLPAGLPPLVVEFQGQTFEPLDTDIRVTSPHHRVSLVRFDADPRNTLLVDTLRLTVADGEPLEWRLPIAYDDTAATSPFGIPWGALLAMMAGLIAAMWPCLLQLTVFFIPSLAGLSMKQAGGTIAVTQRLAVIKASMFFVLGFTIVYTAAGAVLGFTAQRLGDTPGLDGVQRWLGVVGGIVIIGLALRTAARVRAPLVCKMPVLSGMAKPREGAASPWEMMVAGLAFATGCMTCFGAALVLTMVVYIGLSGSVAFGALTMFLFSLGMGIPLVIAAAAMAKVLPMLFKLERVIPWMGLASSVVMIGFALLLITGNYMALVEWLYGPASISLR